MSDFVIKPVYTTTELKNLLGFKKSENTKKFLTKLNVPCQTTGKKDFWMLSDIKSYCPSLFDSILESVGLNSMIAKKPSMEVDEEFYSSLNFK
jgi:hypothetical protein